MTSKGTKALIAWSILAITLLMFIQVPVYSATIPIQTPPDEVINFLYATYSLNIGSLTFRYDRDGSGNADNIDLFFLLEGVEVEYKVDGIYETNTSLKFLITGEVSASKMVIDYTENITKRHYDWIQDENATYNRLFTGEYDWVTNDVYFELGNYSVTIKLTLDIPYNPNHPDNNSNPDIEPTKYAPISTLQIKAKIPLWKALVHTITHPETQEATMSSQTPMVESKEDSS